MSHLRAALTVGFVGPGATQAMGHRFCVSLHLLSLAHFRLQGSSAEQLWGQPLPVPPTRSLPPIAAQAPEPNVHVPPVVLGVTAEPLWS